MTASKHAKSVTELMSKCQKILSLLQKHSYAGPFLYPVDPEALGIPDYPTIVKEPMDLSTVEKKLKTGQYLVPSQFATDIRKIWSNAILYNPKTSPMYETTIIMAEYFDKIYKDVENSPFTDYGPEMVQKQVMKVEKRLDDFKNKGMLPDSELSNAPMSGEEKAQLKKLIKCKPI